MDNTRPVGTSPSRIRRRSSSTSRVTVAAAHADIPLSARGAWAVIGDFGAVRKWATHVVTERLFHSSSGSLRVLDLSDGTTVRESLIDSSLYCYRHRLLDSPQMGDRIGTVSAVPMGSSACRIVLTSKAARVGEPVAPDLGAHLAKLLVRDLDAMQKALTTSD
jgi:hypothetical protein